MKIEYYKAIRIILFLSIQYNVPIKGIKGATKMKEVAKVRGLCYYFIFKITTLNKTQVASLFNRNRKTILDYIQKIDAEKKIYKYYATQLNNLELSIYFFINKSIKDKKRLLYKKIN